MKIHTLKLLQISIKLKVVLSVLLLFVPPAVAEDTNYLISSNQQVWALIRGKSAPKPSSFSATKTRETNDKIANIKSSPINFKVKKFGIKEAYSPTATGVAGRAGVLTAKSDYKGVESSTTYFGTASQKKLPNHARVKNTRIVEIRESNLMIQQLIQNSKR